MVHPEQPWRSPPPGVTLDSEEIHVWRASLDPPAGNLEAMWRTLSAGERQRAGRFHFERDRRRFVVGRGVLRTIMGCYLDRDPGQVEFCYGLQGKPALEARAGSSNLEFNLAHSGAFALCAFTRGRAIGVDVECVRSLPDADQVAARFFSKRENAVYRELPPDEKQGGFYRCWTRKEAYIKASGEGLARPLESFDVSLAPGERARLLSVAGDPDEASRWSLISFAPRPGVVAALAVEGTGLQIACWDFDLLATGATSLAAQSG